MVEVVGVECGVLGEGWCGEESEREEEGEEEERDDAGGEGYSWHFRGREMMKNEVRRTRDAREERTITF